MIVSGVPGRQIFVSESKDSGKFLIEANGSRSLNQQMPARLASEIAAILRLR